MTRAFFMYLSQRPGLRRWLEANAAARRFTRRFIAGETLDEELAACAELAAAGLLTAADHLGENVMTLEEAAAARAAYDEALEAIAARGLPTTIALKLTALGLDVSEAAAEEHLRALALHAARTGRWVEIDMEDTRYTEATVRLAETVGQETGAVRVALQVYLHRTPSDLARMNRARVMVRLCKGAYIEPPTLALGRKRDVDAAFLQLGKQLLEEGVYPALATHDEAMIEPLLAYARERGIPPERFEFEMLYGVRRDLQRALVARGYRVRIYVPYGAQWFRYFMRRLAERPANVWFLLKNLFR